MLPPELWLQAFFPNRRLPDYAQGLGQPRKITNPCFQTTVRELLTSFREYERVPLGWGRSKGIAPDKITTKQDQMAKKSCENYSVFRNFCF